ncbi:hypothetical protein KY290_004161 [Solanum tuberosum]|uniref:Desiccation-related protein PCC13-62 n=1 Tax=Solanum tuberosum TaxID=4113 RepID=A0ABQ7WUY8_SOLTU|nr:hypothetical protein KY290_004161 [Solanum tuberosum]
MELLSIYMKGTEEISVSQDQLHHQAQQTPSYQFSDQCFSIDLAKSQQLNDEQTGSVETKEKLNVAYITLENEIGSEVWMGLGREMEKAYRTKDSNKESFRRGEMNEDLVLVTYMVLNEIFLMSFSYTTNTYCPSGYPEEGVGVEKEDIDKMQFAVNLEFLEAEYFLWASYGFGLDVVAPNLPMSGPPPIGARKANLDQLTNNIIMEFANQEVGHLRSLNSTVGVFSRPLLDLSAKNFAKIFDDAFGHKLAPPFDPYRDSMSYMLSCYVIPYVGLVGYVGTNPNINGYETKRLLAGLLGVESGQDAVIRMYLYERATELVPLYQYTVADFTSRISGLRNKLGNCGIKDEGIYIQPPLGAENRTTSNILSADFGSLSYKRTPAEILRILYGSGDEHVPGGFYPKGANGKIAKEFLKEP